MPRMPLAITLRFDPTSTAMIEPMWRKLAADGIDSDRDQLGYAAHITLAVYPDDVPVQRLSTAIEHTVRDWEALTST